MVDNQYHALWESKSQNSSLAASLDFLRQVTFQRLANHFGQTPTFNLPKLQLNDDGSAFSQFVSDNKLTMQELVAILLALSPHAYPDLLGDLLNTFMPKGGKLAVLGGDKVNNQSEIIPTVDTLLFLLCGTDPEMRWKIMDSLLSKSSFLIRENIISIESTPNSESDTSGRLIIHKEFIDLFLHNKKWIPDYGSEFPAQRLQIKMEWEDLILPEKTIQELELIKMWIKHNSELEKDAKLGRKLSNGWRVLFYGLSGTGKTMTAALIGKEFGMEVFRIDLSQVVSKYIGETEKNLSMLFDTGENRNYILFCDEADALFGKRSNISSAHDRYANQEVSYLLQRIEHYNGLVILATNFKGNLDQAFMRRFQSVIEFPLPDVELRHLLWQKTVPESIELDEDIDLKELAQKYEISGAAIVNIAQTVSLKALSNNRKIIKTDILDEIKKEYSKDSKSM
jgi:AAA+ superfamily predicted ATPase